MKAIICEIKKRAGYLLHKWGSRLERMNTIHLELKEMNEIAKNKATCIVIKT